MKIMAATIGAIIIVSVLLTTFVGQTYRQTLLSRDLARLEQTTHEQALRVVMDLARDARLLQRYAATSAVETALTNPPPGQEPGAFDSLRQEISDIEAAALVSSTGETISFFTTLSSAPQPDPTQWTWFATLEEMPLDTVLISGGSDAGMAGFKGVHFSLPVRDAASGRVAGVLHVVVDPGRYGAGIRDTDMELFLPDGTPIGNWPDLADDAQTQILRSESGSVISDENSPAQVYGYEHIDALSASYLPTGPLSWIVATRQRYQMMIGGIEDEIGRLNLLIAASALALCLATAGICYAFHLSVRRLTDAASQIATTDNVDLPLPRDPSSDLAAIEHGLQSLLDRLKHRATQLQTAAAVSRESITQDVETLLTRIARMIYRQMGLSAVYIYRMEPGGLRANVEVAEGAPAVVTQRPGHSIILSDRSLVGQALHHNELKWAPGLFATFPGAKDQAAEIVIPFHGDAIRALHIVGEPEAFSQFDVNIFRLIASEIAAMLENHRLLEEVDAARAEAERANEVKSKFLASVSHELRTPLNSIINFTRFVQRGVMGPTTSEQDEALGKVINSGRHLLNLINDVLDISKIEADSLELFIEPDISLNEILTRSMPIAQSLLGEKRVELRMEVDSNLPTITADAQRILQIVLNLLSNACKFTQEGSIIISAHQRNDEIILAVKDTGPGIAPEEHELVFETFRQTEAGLRRGGGTGLGMPISRRLAEAHGGRLWLESVPGKGATFFVALPIRSALLSSIPN